MPITVVSNGHGGNKRCEFWHFNLDSNRISALRSSPAGRASASACRPMAKKLYIYGASFEIEVYDAETLKYERTWDLNNDITGAGLAIVE